MDLFANGIHITKHYLLNGNSVYFSGLKSNDVIIEQRETVAERMEI